MTPASVDHRFVLLGASNLTLSFPRIVQALTQTLPAGLELYAVHGHGRSFGAPSRVVVRTLPGILQSQIWDALATASPAVTTRALITDVGNDLLYGRRPDQILDWLQEIVARLKPNPGELVVTRLPLCSVERLTVTRYHVVRQLMFPGKGPSFVDMCRMARELDEGLAALAKGTSAAVIVPRAEWYGLDPVHIRRGQRPAAWSEILSAWDGVHVSPEQLHCSTTQAMRIWQLAPSERFWAGIRHATAQPCLTTPAGLRMSLY